MLAEPNQQRHAHAAASGTKASRLGLSVGRNHIPNVTSQTTKGNSSARTAGIADLFGEPAMPPGFRYAPDMLSPEDERLLVEQFKGLPFVPFEFHGYLGKRRIVSYGHCYDYAARILRESSAIPPFLEPLMAAASSFTGLPPGAFEQALVTEYAPGAGIGWHRDKPMFEDVVGFSFLAPCVLRLRRRSGTVWERRSARMAPQSAYLLHGPVREEWEHSIAPLEVLRYSVTLRTLRTHQSDRLK